MHATRIAALGALLCLAAGSAFAQGTGDKKFYVGLDVGQSKFERDTNFGTATEVDDSSTAYTLRFGYRFNRYFALEAGYTDIGDFSTRDPIGCIVNPPVMCNPLNTETSIDGFLFNAVGTWPIARHFELNASAGAIYREMKISWSDPGLGSGSSSETATVMKFGIGIGVPINDTFEIGLDFTRYQDIGLGYTSSTNSLSTINEGESNVASLGVRWRF